MRVLLLAFATPNQASQVCFLLLLLAGLKLRVRSRPSPNSRLNKVGWNKVMYCEEHVVVCPGSLN